MRWLSKARRLFRERGVRGGLSALRVRLERPFRLFLEARFDRHYGTDTSGVIPLNQLEVSAEDQTDRNWYQPVPENVLRTALNGLAFDFSRFTFIDYGSGKGRALLIASDYPFKNVVGVEFVPSLHAIANNNIRHFHGGERADRIKSICVDAVNFEIPTHDDIVLFFFSPFKYKVMSKVLARIRHSCVVNPSCKRLIIFHGQLPDTIDALRSLGWYEQETSVGRNPINGERYMLLYFANFECVPTHGMPAECGVLPRTRR